MAYIYPFDPTGTSTGNRIVNEQHVITAVNFRTYHYVIPKFAPFFQHNFTIKVQFPDNSVRVLVEGVDYYLSNQFLDASRACAKPVFGSISFLDTSLYGIMSISYNTVGGMWNLTPQEITRILAEEMRNPRITAWEQITYLPERFPVVDHEWDLVDMVGASSVVAAIDAVREAVLSANGGGIASHVADTNNPHATTKAQVGLGSVQNYPIATANQAQAGSANNAYMTPLRTTDAIVAIGGALLAAHSSRVDNPHNTTKEQVGLGNVENYPIATAAQAAAGNINTAYMTPALVKVVSDLWSDNLASHTLNTLNPHNVTKEQVGLFNVENYPIASEQEARAGLLNNRYMTPLRTLQLCREFVSTELDGHATLTNNPHNVTKDQVGLSLVQNYGVAVPADMTAGTANNKYVTPLLVAFKVDQLYSTMVEPHILDENNPHNVTAGQLGVYTTTQVDNMLNGYLGNNATAVNSAKLENRTTEQLRDWLMDNMPGFDAATVEGMTVNQLTSTVVSQVGGSFLIAKKIDYEPIDAAGYGWIKVGSREYSVEQDNPDAINSLDSVFVVTGGEYIGTDVLDEKVQSILVRTNLRSTNVNQKMEAVRLFSSPDDPWMAMAYDWIDAESTLDIYVRVPLNSKSLTISDISGRLIEFEDDFSFVTELSPTMVVLVAEQRSDVSSDADKLGGNLPDYYASTTDLNGVSTAVANLDTRLSAAESDIAILGQNLTALSQSTSQSIAGLSTTVSDHATRISALEASVALIPSDTEARLTAIEQLLASITVI